MLGWVSVNTHLLYLHIQGERCNPIQQSSTELTITTMLIYYALNLMDKHEHSDKFQLFSLPLSGHPAPATAGIKTPPTKNCSRNVLSIKTNSSYFTVVARISSH